MSQLQMNFTTHSRENNPESQANLDANKPHFSKQCQLVWSLLQSGERLTVRDAMVKHNINSLPRRILDLREYFRKNYLPDPIQTRHKENGTKEYYLPK